MARKALTDEEKAAKAAAKEAEKAKAEQEAAERAAAEKAEAAQKDEHIRGLEKMIAEMQAQLQAAQRPQIIQMGEDAAKVSFLWQAEVADDNETVFGDGGMYGRIIGKTGTFAVPKNQLSRLLNGMNRMFLDRRWLIVLDGLTDEEREMLGVDYKEGELLDRRAFAKMIELGDKMLEIYPLLCDGHKEMVAKRYNEAYEAGNPRVTREIVVQLSRLAKDAGRKDDFRNIIEKMNLLDAE